MQMPSCTNVYASPERVSHRISGDIFDLLLQSHQARRGGIQMWHYLNCHPSLQSMQARAGGIECIDLPLQRSKALCRRGKLLGLFIEAERRPWRSACISGRIRKLDLSTSTVTTVAGSASPGSSNGIGTSAKLGHTFSRRSRPNCCSEARRAEMLCSASASLVA